MTVPAMVPSLMTVRSLVEESEHVITLQLDPGPAGFRFAPGQFNMLYAFGVGEAAISISGDPAQPSELVHTLRVVGAVTRALREQARAGAVFVRGPYGRGWPLAEARGGDLLLVAGGLGLAPLRPAVYEVLHQRAHYRDVALVVGARSPDDLLYRSELEQWASAGIQVIPTVDRATAAWPGRVGVVTAALAAARLEPARTTALVCGPELMMRFVERELTRMGVPSAQLFVSLERNMKCAIGLCGHCQLGPTFVCKDGPVVRFDRVQPFFTTREA